MMQKGDGSDYQMKQIQNSRIFKTQNDSNMISNNQLNEEYPNITSSVDDTPKKKVTTILNSDYKNYVPVQKDKMQADPHQYLIKSLKYCFQIMNIPTKNQTVILNKTQLRIILEIMGFSEWPESKIQEGFQYAQLPDKLPKSKNGQILNEEYKRKYRSYTQQENQKYKQNQQEEKFLNDKEDEQFFKCKMQSNSLLSINLYAQWLSLNNKQQNKSRNKFQQIDQKYYKKNSSSSYSKSQSQSCAPQSNNSNNFYFSYNNQQKRSNNKYINDLSSIQMESSEQQLQKEGNKERDQIKLPQISSKQQHRPQQKRKFQSRSFFQSSSSPKTLAHKNRSQEKIHDDIIKDLENEEQNLLKKQDQYYQYRQLQMEQNQSKKEKVQRSKLLKQKIGRDVFTEKEQDNSEIYNLTQLYSKNKEESLKDLINVFDVMDIIRQDHGIIPQNLNDENERDTYGLDGYLGKLQAEKFKSQGLNLNERQQKMKIRYIPYDPDMHGMNKQIGLLRNVAEQKVRQFVAQSLKDKDICKQLQDGVKKFQEERFVTNERFGKQGAKKAQSRLIEREVVEQKEKNKQFDIMVGVHNDLIRSQKLLDIISKAGNPINRHKKHMKKEWNSRMQYLLHNKQII